MCDLDAASSGHSWCSCQRTIHHHMHHHSVLSGFLLRAPEMDSDTSKHRKDLLEGSRDARNISRKAGGPARKEGGGAGSR